MAYLGSYRYCEEQGDRNVQLNVKASQETVDIFYAISDKSHWVLGETFERAMQALQRELQSKK